MESVEKKYRNTTVNLRSDCDIHGLETAATTKRQEMQPEVAAK